MFTSKFFLVGFLAFVCVRMDVSASLFEKFIDQESEQHAPIIRSALQSEEKIRQLPLEKKELLYQVVKEHNLQHNFQNSDYHLQNLYNCIVRFRLLSALASSGDQAAKIYLEEDDKWVHSVLMCSGVYSREYGLSRDSKEDYLAYLKGIWPLVAVFDSGERENLIEALDSGLLKSGLPFLKNPKLLNFFRMIG